MPLKILVVDDHFITCEGLSHVLKGLDEPVQVLQALSCAQALELAALHHDIDLVLLDHDLGETNGFDALSAIGANHPELPIVILSGISDLHVMRQLLVDGAVGFVEKTTPGSELLDIVRLVLSGKMYLPPALLNASPDFDVQEGAIAIDKLTPRQESVLKLMIDGLSNRKIAEQLHLSEETIKTHMGAIFRYFGATTRTQAAVAATHYGYKSMSTR